MGGEAELSIHLLAGTLSISAGVFLSIFPFIYSTVVIKNLWMAGLM